MKQTPIFLNAYPNGNGSLVPLEIAREYPDFQIKRIFYCYGFENGDLRGEHAHIETNQLLICLEGKIHVELFDGHIIRKYLLHKNSAIFIPKLIWSSEFYLDNAMLLCLCDTEYDKNDYLNTQESYVEYLKDHNHL